MKLVIALLNWTSVVAGLISAALWYRATVAKVYDQSTGNWDNPPLVKIENGKTVDILATAERQTELNSYAAAVTGAAGFCAAVALALTQFSN